MATTMPLGLVGKLDITQQKHLIRLSLSSPSVLSSYHLFCLSVKVSWYVLKFKTCIASTFFFIQVKHIEILVSDL